MITTEYFSKLNIKIYIAVAMGFVDLSDQDIDRISEIYLDTLNGKSIGHILPGIITGNAGAANNMWGMSKFSTPRGHGYAAERMNHLYDYIHGKKPVLEGDNNAKNGADRVVGEVNIQSKYCVTGKACIEECFDKKTKEYRYRNSDGTSMKIEVPSDKYDEAVAVMEEKIREGKIPGHTNPEDAKDIVVKGKFTYEQAKRVAQAGTIESLTFDAINASIICTHAFGISFVITFALSIWSGESLEDALFDAVYAGIEVAGIEFITSVLSAQIGRSAVAVQMSREIANKLVNLIGSENAALIANVLREGGKNIYGAAASKYLSKILANNLITGAISAVVLSAGDIKDIFFGRISGGQFVKNVASTTAGMAGGYAGMVKGAAMGTPFGPVGTFVGGVIGGLLCSAVSQTVANETLDLFIDDDTKEVLPLIENEIVKLSREYLLTPYEIENVGDNFGGDITESTFKDIYSSNNRVAHIDSLLMKYINIELSYRAKVHVPVMGTENALVEVLS